MTLKNDYKEINTYKNRGMTQRYTFEKLQELTNEALVNKDMPKHLYKSVNSLSKVFDAIIQTEGVNWAAQVVDDEGKPLLTPQEQKQFQSAFQPYIQSILSFFDSDHKQEHVQEGGKFNPAKASGLTPNFLEKKEETVTGTTQEQSGIGIDDVYEKMLNKIQGVDDTVNNYASKYGILRLEKEHDLEGDVQIIPEPAVMGISDALFTVSEGVILPTVTQDVLSKVKIPFRVIVTFIYLTLDIVRLSVGVLNMTYLRKIMSIVVSLVELLRGEWKKAILSFIGYYGMTPMLFGELAKIFITMFQMLAPQLQEDILLGVLDTTKSFIIGVLLSVFQVTAPEQVRLPVIGALERIAQMKAKIDGDLVEAGMSARPNYLTPTFADLNNIQAVFSDEAFVCSTEFQNAISDIKQVTLLRIILELMRIPVTEKFFEMKCGVKPKTFTERIADEAIERKEKEEPKTTEEPGTTEEPKTTEEPETTGTQEKTETQEEQKPETPQLGGSRILRAKKRLSTSS